MMEFKKNVWYKLSLKSELKGTDNMGSKVFKQD